MSSGRGRGVTVSYSRCAPPAGSGCTPQRTRHGSAACRPTSPTGCPRPRQRAALGDGPGTHLPEPAGPAAGSEPFAELRRALDAFDEPAAQAVLDRLIAELSLPAVLRDIILPCLADLGQRWQAGTASIAAEHFASNLIRGRLAGLARGWAAGTGRGPCWPARPASCTTWPW